MFQVVISDAMLSKLSFWYGANFLSGQGIFMLFILAEIATNQQQD